MSKPWMKFYPADWQADPAVRSCSISARGMWVEMLCLMQKAEPVGYLLVNGRAPTAKALSVLCGTTDKEARRALQELEDAGVFSRNDDGVIFSRRMVRDEAKAARDKANGSKGGNPAVIHGVNPPDNPTVDGGDKAQKPEARVQSSVPDGTGADAPSIDPEKKAWDDAVALLTSTGRMKAGPARGFIGKLLSDNGIKARDLLPAIGNAIANQTQDPAAYLRKAAAGVASRTGGGGAAPAKPDEITRDDWVRRIGMWRKDGWWQGAWGPRPDERGCVCPPDLLEDAA